MGALVVPDLIHLAKRGIVTSSNPAIKIAVLTDIHYGGRGALTERRGEIADILLLRAVHRLNRLIRPDVVIVLGDLLDDGDADGAHERLVELRAILDLLTAPALVLPGNHDGDPEAFYRVFARPPDVVDIAGARFLPFVDPEAPGYNATRRAPDLERFRQARSDFDGPLVALQHVCLVPPERTDVPYNYTNAPAVIAAMAAAGVALSISGHHHAGSPLIRNATTSFVTAPALCEAPFHFTLIHLAGDAVTHETHQLAMPAHLGLVDHHVHTQLAYCSENMDVGRAIALARDMGLAGIGFAEHAGQLRFPVGQYWGGDWGPVGIAGAQAEHDRMGRYLALKERWAADDVRFGLEVDIDDHGHLLLQPGDRESVDHLIGAVHRTPHSSQRPPSPELLADEFLALTAELIASGIDILAHPFRLFRRAGLTPPAHLYRPVAELLRRHHVAAELNVHTNAPPVDFVRLCLEMEVPISLGSDAHNLYEVGEFADHLQLLAAAGFDGDPADILVPLGPT